tara:strand:- start:171 stop:434 length:264 start_codon:yes stop_codon:yes gene_type:complete
MLEPMNKYLLVKPVEEEKKESGILVPEDYKVNHAVHSLVTLLRSHDASNLDAGMRLIVPTHMIEEINLFGEKSYVVLENNVIGFFHN